MGVNYNSNALNFSGAPTFSALYSQDNIRWVRLGVVPASSWTTSMYDPAVSAKMNIVGIISGEIFGAGSIFQNSAWNLTDWDTAVKYIVNQYPSIHDWEIWNEADRRALNYNGPGYFNGSASTYFDILKDAYNIIKAHNTSDTVICFGGLSNFDEGVGAQGTNFFSYVFAQQVWALGSSKYCDAVSIHAYTGFTYLLNDTVPSLGMTAGQVWQNNLNDFESLFGNMPIWITETGIPSNSYSGYNSTLPMSPQKQALFLTQSFSFMLSEPNVKAVFWWDVVQNTANHPDRDYGLFNASTGSPKPVFYAFENIINGPITLTSTTSSVSAQPLSFQSVLELGVGLALVAAATVAIVIVTRKRKVT